MSRIFIAAERSTRVDYILNEVINQHAGELQRWRGVGLEVFCEGGEGYFQRGKATPHGL